MRTAQNPACLDFVNNMSACGVEESYRENGAFFLFSRYIQRHTLSDCPAYSVVNGHFQIDSHLPGQRLIDVLILGFPCSA